MNGVVPASKVERHIEVLSTWYCPPLVFRVKLSTLNTSIDSIGNGSWKLSQGEAKQDISTYLATNFK